MKRALILALLALPALAPQIAAQETTAPVIGDERIVSAPGGKLRFLDKVSGETADLDLSRGQAVVQGYLTVQLDECRYPADDPAGDAFAHLTISDSRASQPVFSGWMIATSPALSAMDHARYDVWVLHCLTS